MRPGHLGPLLVLAIACTASHTEEPCPNLPCPSPGLAFEITLTGSPAGTPVKTASYRVLPNGTPVACNQGASGNMCEMTGSPGTYQVEISAMFYETVQRTVVVTAKPAPRCSCPVAQTQSLTIAMSPTS